MSIPRIDLDSLIIDQLTPIDLTAISWSGGPAHIQSVAAALERVASGAVEYLAVRTSAGEIVAIGGINYAEHPGQGSMWQLAAKYTGLGIGTRLIQAMEARMRARGVTSAILGVEENNPRARHLYEKLGYRASGTENCSWESTDAQGNSFIYHTTCILLSKQL